MLCLVDQRHVKSCFSWAIDQAVIIVAMDELVIFDFAANIADAMSSEYNQKTSRVKKDY